MTGIGFSPAIHRGFRGRIKSIPTLPIVVLAEDKAELSVLPANAAEPAPELKLDPADWTRWNDYGIGLLLQGDLKEAAAAFAKITQIAPENPDGWVNIGRARFQEGNLAAAKTVLEKRWNYRRLSRGRISFMPRCCEIRGAMTMPPRICE